MVSIEKIESTKEIFKKNGGVLRTSDAIRVGIHPRTLYFMRDTGELTRISRGVYMLSELEDLSDPDFVTVSLRVPKAVVCLISALSFHDITTQVPHKVDIALPRGVKAPSISWPPVKVYRFSEDSYNSGIDLHIIDGQQVRIYSPGKTIADCFKFRNKIGIDVVVEALRFCITQKRSDYSTILEYARICGVEKVITPYLEAMI